MSPRSVLAATFALGAVGCTALKPATDRPDAAAVRDVVPTPDAAVDAPVDDLATDAPADVAADHADVALDVPTDTGPATTSDPTQVPPPRPLAPLSGSVVGASMPIVQFVMPGGFTTGARVEVCLDRDCMLTDRFYTPTVGYAAGTIGSIAVALPSGHRQFFWRVRGISGTGSSATSGSVPSAPWLLQVDPPTTERTLVQPSLKDINHDGFADIYVGAPGEITWCCQEGRAHAFLGQSASPGIATTDAPAFQYPGMLQQNPNAATGTGAAIVGDMDGDGFADTATGGPCLGGSSGTCGPGAVAVTFGGASTAFTAPLLNGAGGTTERFGATVAGLSDFNGDGLADLAIGVPVAGGEAGALVLARTVLSGSARRTLSSFRVVPTGDVHLGGLGNSLASAGDVDGDGLTDVVIGAPNTFGYIGTAYLVFGTTTWSDTMTTPSPAYTEIVTPFSGTGNFGRGVAGLGDVNGDGYADFAISAPTNSGGAVVIYYGRQDARTTPPTRALEIDAPTGVTYFGQSVAGVGDLNGDGFGDLAIGSPNPTTDMADGQVWIYLGGPSGLTSATPSVAVATLGPVRTGADGGTPLDSTTGEFGWAIAAAGDVNGDGFGDMVVSAPIAPAFHDPSSGSWITFGGRVLLYLGTASGVNQTPVVLPSMPVSPGNKFGTSVSLAAPRPGRGGAA